MTEFFLHRYQAIDSDVVTAESDERQAIRVNTMKTTPEKLVKRLEKRGVTLEKIPFLKYGYYVEAEFSLGSTQEYLLGLYFLQAPLSQLACEILNPDDDVLDMAAAPGGKATYLAQMIPDAMLVALDKDPGRLDSVRNNVERLGLTNVVCVKQDARFAADLKKTFSFVILDAPCSGNFCSEPDWFSKRTIHDIKANARLQKEMIKAAYQCLKPGGKLLYSTCSLEPEENECIVDWAIKRYPDLNVLPLDIELGDPGTTEWEGKLDPRMVRTRRFWPHKTKCEGFFIALLEKKG